MTRNFAALIIFTVIYYLINSCANPGSPTGGPRDTIPPIRLSTNPEHKSINYTGKTITMEFDEPIKTDNLKEQLIITPLTESDYESTIKKNTLKLTFDEPFKDSTTYTLNFRESIQDITESNPTKDNKFTFSTGSFLDSLSISGYVKELLTYDTLESVLIGLYKANDTINIFNGSPYYFTETDEKGNYLIENIKNGKYLLHAFLDENKNLKLETNNELYGFNPDTLQLDSGTVYKNIDLIGLDLNDLKILSSTMSGKYYEINLNKSIMDYTITPIKNTHTFYTNLSKENKSIRFYNNFKDIDSLQVAVLVKDSVDNIITDSVYVKFAESRRSPDEFSYKITPENNASIETRLKVNFKFNKPIITVNADSMYIQFDTTLIQKIYDSLFIWNSRKDQMEFEVEIDKTKADTILQRRIRMEQQKKDSLIAQQNDIQEKQQISKGKTAKEPQTNKGLQLFFGKGSFYSADLDTSKTIALNYKFIDPKEFGIQELRITTNHQNFIVQLLKENYEVAREIKNEKLVTFKNIKPGKYKIRILIDTNKSGTWNPGNMKKQIEPEPVYIYPDVLVIRADWQTSLDIAF